MDDRFNPVERGRGAARSGGPPSVRMPSGCRLLNRLALAAALTAASPTAVLAQGTGQAGGQAGPSRIAAPNTGTLAASSPRRLVAPPPVSSVPLRPASTQLGIPAQAVAVEQRQHRASLISSDILSAYPQARQLSPPEPVVESLTVLRLRQRSEQLTVDAELALRRGALRSARESAIEALQSAAAAADLQSGHSAASAALDQALTAIREAGDLVGRYGHVGPAELRRLVQSHQTPVLHGSQLATLTPYAAADIYLDFAREALTRAAAGRREVAGTLLWLSRAELANRQQHGELAEAVALNCLRAAVSVAPDHAVASNELGYRAMQLGLLSEAQWALERSYQLQPSEPALRNLIETHRLAGDIQTARELVALLPSFGGPASSVGPEVLQVDPHQFAAISPPVQTAAAAQPQLASGAGSAGTAAQQGPPRRVTGGTSGGPQPQGGSAQGPVSVLERVAGSVRSLWD